MIHLCVAVYMTHYFAEFTDLNARFHNIVRDSAFGIQIFRRDEIFNYDNSLLSLLKFTRNTESTDSRDKVYASRDLATDLSLISVLLDYSKSVKAVYSDVVRFSLSQSDQKL